jgi:hypothetical protein
MKETTTLQIRSVPIELHEALRKLAYEHRTSINSLGIRAVEEFCVRELENLKKGGK